MKSRVSFLTVTQTFNLDTACEVIDKAFGHAPYHVGSSLERADFHDVDLRMILDDEEFDRMFSNNLALKFLNTAVSEWIAARTGLPIDFQFQRQTEANEKYKGVRNARGIRFRGMAKEEPRRN